jgi:quercetin 2,3-dioxygenase
MKTDRSQLPLATMKAPTPPSPRTVSLSRRGVVSALVVGGGALVAASATASDRVFAGSERTEPVLPKEKPMSMIIRRSAERGHAEHGWLDSHHTFSFADYYDPQHMGFRALRVINEDRVEPGRGFGTHGHRDMEIISYVLDGVLEHKDSLGTHGIIRPGDVQRMTAGSGVRHSEQNGSAEQGVHFLQIWIQPDRTNLAPSYEQKAFSDAEKQGKLRLVASPDGRQESVTIHQDACLFAGLFAKGEQTTYELAPGRHAWVHVARGSVKLNGTVLQTGDAAAIDSSGKLTFEGEDAGEVLLFDLA